MSEKRSSWEQNGIFLRHIEQCIYIHTRAHTHTESSCASSAESKCRVAGNSSWMSLLLSVAAVLLSWVPAHRSRMQQLQEHLQRSHHVAVLCRWDRRILEEMENSCLSVMQGFLITNGTTPDQMTGSLSLFISLSACTNKHTCTQTHTHNSPFQ